MDDYGSRQRRRRDIPERSGMACAQRRTDRWHQSRRLGRHLQCERHFGPIHSEEVGVRPSTLPFQRITTLLQSNRVIKLLVDKKMETILERLKASITGISHGADLFCERAASLGQSRVFRVGPKRMGQPYRRGQLSLISSSKRRCHYPPSYLPCFY